MSLSAFVQVRGHFRRDYRAQFNSGMRKEFPLLQHPQLIACEGGGGSAVFPTT